MSVTRCFTFGSGHAETLGIPFPSFVHVTMETKHHKRVYKWKDTTNDLV